MQSDFNFRRLPIAVASFEISLCNFIVFSLNSDNFTMAFKDEKKPNNPYRRAWLELEHDDVCFECGNPGTLVECDECPR